MPIKNNLSGNNTVNLSRSNRVPTTAEQVRLVARGNDAAFINKAEAIESFFTDVMQVKEVDYKKNINHDSIKKVYKGDTGEPVWQLKVPHTEHDYVTAGFFEEKTIKELQELTKHIDEQDEGNGSLSVIDGSTWSPAWPAKQYVDIAFLQSCISNNDAVFQVASNYNALETVSSCDNIMKDAHLEHYPWDCTQGPVASISASPGLILRRYFMFYEQNKHKHPQKWGQTHTQYINFLSNLESYIPMAGQTPGNYMHGYQSSGYVDLAKVVKEKIYPCSDFKQKIKMGFHRDIEVTHSGPVVWTNNAVLFTDNPQGPYNRFFHLPTDCKRYVNQVFTAAVDLQITNSPYRNNPLAQAWAELILDASYEGTIRTAAAYNKKRLFLTLVGGGVFNNKMAWIINSIQNMKNFIIKSGLEVIIVVWSWPPEHLCTTHDKIMLQYIVKQTGGIWASDHNSARMLITNGPLKQTKKISDLLRNS